MKKNVPPLVARFFLLFAGIAFAILVAEVILRWSDFEGLSLMDKDPLLGQKYKPNLRRSVYSVESGKSVIIETNSLGFRDREPELAQKRRRIVILGDSFTAGFSVPFENTFSQKSQQFLNRNSGEEWEVANLGVAGFGTAQELIAYREHGRKFRPEVVVLCFFAGNDVSDNSSELSSNPRIYFRLDERGNLVMEPPGRLRTELSSFLNDHSRFYLWQKHQFRKLEHYYKTQVKLNPAHRVFLADYDEKMQRAWAITGALLKELKVTIEKSGARMVVFYIPFSDEVNPDWWKETYEASGPMQKEKWDLEKPERVLSELCATYGIEFVSVRESFLNDWNSGKRLYFPHGHFNERGHEEFGKRIAEWVLRIQR